MKIVEIASELGLVPAGVWVSRPAANRGAGPGEVDLAEQNSVVRNDVRPRRLSAQ